MIKVNPLIVFRKEFDDSGILFDPATSDTFGLNPTAVAVYELLKDGTAEENLLTELGKKVALPAEAAADVAEFLAALRTRGYIGDI